jgi:uncharacterized repeat protein (TIGR03803 family)/parallel beta-helix repeat protein
MVLKWWRKLIRTESKPSRRERRKLPHRRWATFEPWAELLEQRLAPSLTVAIAAPANGSFTDYNRPTLSATVTDDLSGGGIASVQFQYSSNGLAWSNAGASETAAPFTYTFPSALPDGTYQVRAIATDNAGNSAISTYGLNSLTSLASFSAPDGLQPQGGIVRDSSGDMFGTASGGGPFGCGTVFEVPAGSSIITTLASFNNANGSGPSGNLVRDGSGNLFGTTQYGGASGQGTVFEVKAGDSAITTLASFDYFTNGGHPYAGLVADGSGNLFGTTQYGGASGQGTVFEVKAGDNSITTLASFTNSNWSYAQQPGVIVDISGNLFGTTLNGGASGSGTVFEVKAGSGAITTLASFNSSSNGLPSSGNLVSDSSGDLFGTTRVNGPSGYGAVFELPAGSGAITTLASFNYTNGSGPSGGLVRDGSGNLFGITAGSGAFSDGTVFELQAGSSAITTLASLSNVSGYFPTAALVEDGSGNLFGTGLFGGAGYGTVLEVKAGSGTATALASFTAPDGLAPAAGVIRDSNGNLFGTTSGGAGYGTVFEVKAGSGAITTLASFNGSNGAAPYGNLVADGSGDLFGTTRGGGAFSDGTVFEVKAGSNAITTLVSFHRANGTAPNAGLAEDDNGNLFGTTYAGGASDDGTVFELPVGSNAITTLASFNGANGSTPYGGVVEDGNGDLFGTTTYGGASNDGTVFEVKAGSGAVTTLASFSGTNGANPYAGVVEDGSGNLFGTTEHGGASGDGTVFEMKASGAITILASFSGSNGAVPLAGLVEDSSGNLFGTTQVSASGQGTVFEVAAGSNVITTLASFNGTNGAAPFAGLLEDGSGDFFGTATSGGTSGGGTVFELTPSVTSFTIDTVPPTVTFTVPANGSTLATNEPTLSATAADNSGGSGLASVQFQYSSDGGASWANAGSAETSGPFSYTFPTALPDGTYQVQAVATDNAGSSATCAPVTFTIDTVAPTVTLTAPASGSTTNNRPILTATGADNSGGSGLAGVQFQYSPDGGVSWINAGASETAAPFRYTFTTALAQGAYEARAVATDNAGNSATSAPVSFTVGPTTYWVTTTQNGVAGSLQRAIRQANTDNTGTAASPDVIAFNLPANDPNHYYYQRFASIQHIAHVPTVALDGVTPITSDSQLADPTLVGAYGTIASPWPHSWWTFPLINPLAPITDIVTIDGYTQPGASPNTLAEGDNAILRIQLNGGRMLSNYAALTLNTGTSSTGGSTVRGLDITTELGITGGFGNGADGIWVKGGGNNHIEGNFIGTDISGLFAANLSNATALTISNPHGIVISDGSQGNVIGTNGIPEPGSTQAAADAARRNLISGNNWGVAIDGDIHNSGGTPPGGYSGHNIIAGNFIGTDSSGAQVIGSDPDAGQPTGSRGSPTGPAPANWAGIGLERNASGDQIGADLSGDDVAGMRNVISGNKFGVLLAAGGFTEPAAINCLVAGNFIGTTAQGLDLGTDGNSLGNWEAGVAAGIGAQNCQILDNVIANTTGYAYSGVAGGQVAGVGVAISSYTRQAGYPLGIRVEGNSIYGNSGLGIDLGLDYPPVVGADPPLPNGAEGSGPNNQQHYPMLGTAQAQAGGTRVTGTFSSLNPGPFTLDFYANPSQDPTGYGQGKQYLGRAEVSTDAAGKLNGSLDGSAIITTDSSGNPIFVVNLQVATPVGNWISATATDVNGDTSEFALSTPVIGPFVVINTTDAGPGSLRQAIFDANYFGATYGGTNTVTFAIPTTDPGYNYDATGVFAIRPQSALPTVTAPVVIDGTTEPGYNGTPLIELDGASAGAGVNGLVLTAGASTVEGLAINRFGGNGVEIDGNGGDVITGNYIGTDATGTSAAGNGDGIAVISVSNVTIGGTAAGARNIISGNKGAGVVLGSAGSLAGASGVLVQGNYIGTNAAGTAALAGQYYGVEDDGANNNTISGNVISGNADYGLDISSSSNVLVQGNYIGTDASGTSAIGNGSNAGGGVFVNDPNNTIGGTTAGTGNVISGNNGDGLDLSSGTGNVVEGNYIGTDATGTTALGNAGNGVRVVNAGANTLSGNTISGNGQEGVSVSGSGGAPGLISYYPLDTSTNDSLGNNNPSATSGVSFVPGHTANGATFVPGGGYIDIPDSPSLDQQQITLAAWAEPQGPCLNNDSYGSPIIVKGLPLPAAGNTVSIATGWRSTDDRFGCTIGSLDTQACVTADTFSPGQFYFVVATYDRTTLKVYVNGKLEGQETLSQAIQYDPTNSWTIGSTPANIRAVGYPRTWPGVIDDVAIYDRALSQSEIQALMNSTEPTQTGNLIQGNRIGTNASGTGALPNAGDGIQIDRSANLVQDDLIAYNHGSGIANSGGTVTVSNCDIASNSATGNGGGILNSGTLSVNNCTLSGNSAGDGGGIYSNGQLTVTGSTFSGNSASDGGGIYIDFDGQASVANSTFSNNSSTGLGNAGGAIDLFGSLAVSDSMFSGNSAFFEGGAIAENGNDSGVTVSNSTFTGNSAYWGGAIAMDPQGNPGAELLFIASNSTFSGNSADEGGAILGNDTAGDAIIQAKLTNLTITQNRGNTLGNGGLGGGIFISDCHFLLDNSIVAGNLNGTGPGATPDDIGGGLDSTSGYNLIGTGGSGGLQNGVNANQVGVANPGLAPLGDYGGPTQTMALLPGSPAIDAGTAAGGPATDQRGYGRVGAVDIGAFESQGFAVTVIGGNYQDTPIASPFARPLTVHVTANNPAEPVDGGRVTFVAPASGASAMLNPATAGISGGQASATATANGTAGSYVVTATAAGAASVDFSLTNDKAVTTTVAASSTNPSVYGQAVTFTATVTASGAPAGALTGTVQFVIDGQNYGAPVALSGGTASVRAAALAAGRHTVAALYSGDGNFLPSDNTAAPLSQVVIKANAGISIIPYSGTYDGQPHGLGGTATGALGEDLSGLLNLGPTYTNAGAYTVGWSFAGNANYNAASGGSTVTIAQATPAFSAVGTTVITDGTPSVMLTGTISDGSLIPTGSVTVTLDSVSQTAAIGAGGSFSATFATGALNVGVHSIAFGYGGDLNFTTAGASGSLDDTYGILAQFNQTRAVPPGSTLSIKIALATAAGQDVSSAGVAVTALGIAATNDTTDAVGAIDPSQVGTLMPPQSVSGSDTFTYKGGANPYYSFKLVTSTGLAAGTYRLYFSVAGDPLDHWVTFTVG